MTDLTDPEAIPVPHTSLNRLMYPRRISGDVALRFLKLLKNKCVNINRKTKTGMCLPSGDEALAILGRLKWIHE